MKILHIGREENMERYPAPDYIAEEIETVSLPMGKRPEDYLDAMEEAQVIVADAMADVPGALIRKMPHLKMIHSEGVAYNRIDLKTAKEREIYVCNCRGMNASAVAEQTVFLMQGMLKNVLLNDRGVREGRQIQIKEGYMVRGDLKELSDCKAGLIGLGDIGKSTAALLAAYHTETYYYKRHPLSKEEEKQYKVTYLPLEKLLETCDIISLHLPVTEETQGMCDKNFFGKMKEGAYFVNTSRGELVDDQALINALKAEKLSMAALDTLSHEPVQKDHILLRQPEEIRNKLLFSPHIGGITASSFRRGYAMIWENVGRILRGEKPMNVVNEK